MEVGFLEWGNYTCCTQGKFPKANIKHCLELDANLGQEIQGDDLANITKNWNSENASLAVHKWFSLCTTFFTNADMANIKKSINVVGQDL